MALGWIVALLGLAAADVCLSGIWRALTFPVAAGLGLLSVLAGRHRARRPAPGADRDRPGLLPSAALILGLLLVYYLNPTHRWTEGVGLLPVPHLPLLPGSAFPPGTLQTLWFAAGALAVFGLARNLSNADIPRLQAAVALGGAAMALLVIWQRLLPRPFPVFEYTGGFANENHFAVFANLILPVTLAAASRCKIRALHRGEPSSPAGLFYVTAGLLAAAILLSRSRAGVAVMTLLLLGHLLIERRFRQRHPFLAAPPTLLGKAARGLVVLAACAALLNGFVREWKNLNTVRMEGAFRWRLMADTVAVWRAQPWWGSGPGTFAAVFPYYQSDELGDRAFLHAHCEGLQFLSEYGILGAAWFGVALARLRRAPGRGTSARREESRPHHPFDQQGFALGLAGCALHSLVDFPLRIPLLALLAVTWTGVLMRGRKDP